jgi:hypothetical protein
MRHLPGPGIAALLSVYQKLKCAEIKHVLIFRGNVSSETFFKVHQLLTRMKEVACLDLQLQKVTALLN